MPRRKAVALGALAALVAAVGWTAQRGERGDGSCREARAAAAWSSAIREARPLARGLWRDLRGPGFSLAVAMDGRVVWSISCGFANRERGIPATASTRYRVASISKPLTIAAVARLYDGGKLDLDAPIRRYVPAFPRKRWPITLRQLAGHLAGLRRNRAAEIRSCSRYRSVGEELRVFAGDPLRFRPGTRYSYSNFGFVLLGAAVERASGQPYERFMRAAVLEPLGLRHTVLDDAGHRVPERARPYELTSDGSVAPAPCHDVSVRWPSGGFLSTPEDLVRFASGFVGGTFLRPTTVRTFLRSQRTVSGRPTGYGLGWMTFENPAGTIAGHTGHTVGGTALLLVVPRERAAVAAATNVGYVVSGRPPPANPGLPDLAAVLRGFLRG